MSFNPAKFLFGWLTPKRKERTRDDFAKGYEAQCVRARNDAVRWYIARYGTAPRIPAVKVTVEPRPRDGMGGWANNAHDVHIWSGQRPFMGSLEHEFRHTLAMFNGKGGSEAAVK